VCEYPKEVALADGQIVQLRPLRRDDEAALVKFFSALPPESTEFLKHDVRDPATVKRFVEHSDPDTIWAILAETKDGKIVGDATLHVARWGWRRHVGEVRGVVAAEYRHRGLATHLVHELVDQARVRNLKKLEAQILDSQLDAKRVFERLGFREEARLRQHALDLHGRLHDVLLLTNSVDELWVKMEELISSMEIAGGRF
jgi:RimJ/RimL family protein N-acetyltransferase